MSRPVPFLFDVDFGRPAQPAAAAAPLPAAPGSIALDEHEAALADAEASGYRRGEADGRRAAREAEAARLISAVEALGARLSEAFMEADTRAEATERDAVALALAFAQKFAAAAAKRFPLAEIQAAAETCFAELRSAPHLAVRVAPDFVEAVRAELTATAQERGFAGRLVVLGDPDVAEGDARLEWADGGVVRDGAAVARAVEQAIALRFGPPSPMADDEGAQR